MLQQHLSLSPSMCVYIYICICVDMYTHTSYIIYCFQCTLSHPCVPCLGVRAFWQHLSTSDVLHRENIFTLLYNSKRPITTLHLISKGLNNGTYGVVTGMYTIQEWFGWMAALEEHSSNAADMKLLFTLHHRKRRAQYVGYMLFLEWYASCLQKSSSLSSAGSQLRPQEYGWCPDSHI